MKIAIVIALMLATIAANAANITWRSMYQENDIVYCDISGSLFRGASQISQSIAFRMQGGLARAAIIDQDGFDSGIHLNFKVSRSSVRLGLADDRGELASRSAGLNREGIIHLEYQDDHNVSVVCQSIELR